MQDGFRTVRAGTLEHGQSQYLCQRVGGIMDALCVYHLHLADGETRDGADDELRRCVLGPDLLFRDYLLVYSWKELLYWTPGGGDCG